MIALTAQELIAWTEATSTGFEGLLTAHPEALAFPCDISGTRSVAEFVQHIVAVELRYAERLHGLPETPYEEVPMNSAAALYAKHDRAFNLVRELEDRDEHFWDEAISFTTRRGDAMHVDRRHVLVHMLMHSIRHYAQLATLVRQQGVAPAWPMDYLFMAPRVS